VLKFSLVRERNQRTSLRLQKKKKKKGVSKANIILGEEEGVWRSLECNEAPGWGNSTLRRKAYIHPDTTSRVSPISPRFIQLGQGYAMRDGITT